MTLSPTSRRHFVAGSAALVAGAALPGLARADGDVLRLRWHTDIQSLDPAFHIEEGSVMGAIYSKLIDYKPFADTWEWDLDAAQSIEQVDPTHVAFTLRPGITFSHGFGELTADDVKFSFERHLDPALGSAYAGDWSALDHVEVTGTHAGTIVLKEPYAPLFLTTLCWVSGMILSRKAVESIGGKIGTKAPATSGPYGIKEWQPKQKLVLAANPDWTGSKPDFSVVEILPIDDDKAAEIAFEAGEVDFTSISLSSVPKYRAATPPGAALKVTDVIGLDWIGMNTEAVPFDDPRVRKAVRLAIDVPAILEAAYFGVAHRATGIVAPSLVGHRESVLQADRDVDRARQLLAEAGFADGFTARMAIIDNTDFKTAAQVAQANLAEIGIDLRIDAMEAGVWWTLGLESEGDAWKTLQMYLSRWSLLPDPSWATMWFIPEQVGVYNWERWRNPEFADLHKAALKELDPARRQAMFERMQDLMEESDAYVWLTNGVWPVLYRDTLEPATTADGRWPMFQKFRRSA